MKDIIRRSIWLGWALLLVRVPLLAQTNCDTSKNLSAPVTDFEVQQTSPVEALLRLGEKYNLCYGIEYVDRPLLTEPADFYIKNNTIEGALKLILASVPDLRIQTKNGVIEISRNKAEARTLNIFDHVIPKWETQRLPVVMVSFILHGELMKTLNPQMKGFAGNAGRGNPHDEIGPFKEYNRPVRYLLDKIVAQSSGAAWIATASWVELQDMALPEDRRVWTIVEYEGPNAQYGSLLRSIAERLPNSDSLSIGK